MNNRQRALAILRYQPYDRVPVVHFGFWRETLLKWAAEGHLTENEAMTWGDGVPCDAVISEKLGFDFNWYSVFHPSYGLNPRFEGKVIKTLPDGSQHVLSGEGVVVVVSPNAGSIPAEIEHLLKDRASWEAHYAWRYKWNPERVTKQRVRVNDTMVPFDQGGLDFLKADKRDYLYGLHCGSLYGQIRNVLGVEGSSYLYADDETLFTEIIDTVADLCYKDVKAALDSGAKFDFAHFWEDICFKNGPLISPAVFEEKVGPHYKRITDLCARHGLETYGQAIRGVGGMNKTVFAKDRKAVDQEVARLKELAALGGFIPCPDHRLAPDSKWDLVRYYCDKMRETFG
jgi:hypothetical protein